MDSSFALLFPARRPMTTAYKIPRSVLVVIHTPDLRVLMMERAGWQGFWQSVTGSLAHESEPLRDAAIREVREETGLDAARYDLRDWESRTASRSSRSTAAATLRGSRTTSSTCSASRCPGHFR